MKLSKYNIYERFDSSLYITNTLTGNIVNITDCSTIDKISYMRESYCDKFNNDLEIKKLKEMKFIVKNSNIEKEEIGKLIQNNETLTITLFITNQCNFRCTYCYEKHENKKLSIKSYSIILHFIKKELCKHKFSDLRLNLFGGEPLLELNNVIAFFSDLARIKNINLSVGLTINGYNLNKEIIYKLYKLNITDIQITIDGFAKTHDCNRKLINGGDTWNKIMGTLDEICEMNVPIKIIIRTNFNSNTLRTEKQFLSYCKIRFKNKFIMHFESIKDWGASCENLEYLDKNKEFSEVLNLVEYCRMNKIKTTYESVLDLGYNACPHNMKNSYIFDVDLRLLKCTVELTLPEIYVGILKEDGDLVLNKNAELWKEHNLDNSECIECKMLPQCLSNRCPVNKVKNKVYSCDSNKEVAHFKLMLHQYY